jgi:hypothetical protein
MHREVLSSKCFNNEGGSNRSSRTLGNFAFSAQRVVIRNWRDTGIALKWGQRLLRRREDGVKI